MDKAEIKHIKEKVLAEEAKCYMNNYALCSEYYDMAVIWLEDNIGTKSRKWISSYGLKHQCENDLPPFGNSIFSHGYISNNLMKVALLESGYKCRTIDFSPITEDVILDNSQNLYNNNYK